MIPTWCVFCQQPPQTTGWKLVDSPASASYENGWAVCNSHNSHGTSRHCRCLPASANAANSPATWSRCSVPRNTEVHHTGRTISAWHSRGISATTAAVIFSHPLAISSLERLCSPTLCRKPAAISAKTSGRSPCSSPVSMQQRYASSLNVQVGSPAKAKNSDLFDYNLNTSASQDQLNGTQSCSHRILHISPNTSDVKEICLILKHLVAKSRI